MFYKVKEQQAVIIESAGGRCLDVKTTAGMKFNMPFKFRKVAARVPLNVTQHDMNLKTKTSDNIFADVPTSMFLQVVDAKKFHYNSPKPYDQVEVKVTNVMKQLTNGMEFDHLYQERETLSSEVRDKIGKEIENLYGLKIISVLVDQPVAPQSIQESYNNAKASEQIAIGALNKAQALKKATIFDAEARSEALRLDGEGVAAQRLAMFKNLPEQVKVLTDGGIPQEEALKTIMRMMEFDTIRDAAKNGNVIVTTTADKDSPITDMQAASRSLAKLPPKPPAPGQ